MLKRWWNLVSAIFPHKMVFVVPNSAVKDFVLDCRKSPTDPVRFISGTVTSQLQEQSMIYLTPTQDMRNGVQV